MLSEIGKQGHLNVQTHSDKPNERQNKRGIKNEGKVDVFLLSQLLFVYVGVGTGKTVAVFDTNGEGGIGEHPNSD